MAQNTGTLVIAPIRPLTDIMPIATAYSSEIKGGLHSVSDIASRNQIATNRREFGMLVYVKSSGEFYQLRQTYSPDVADDSNWMLLQLGPSASNTGDWQDSVISATSGDPSVLVPNIGDRYLVISGAGAWLGLDDNIVEWNGSWDVISPSEGMSVRSDNDQGPIWSYFSGSWVRQTMDGGDPYIEHTINYGSVINIATSSQYMVYGDFEINGTVNNYGEVVVLNGTVTGTGSMVNKGIGTLQQVDMLTEIYGGTAVTIVPTSLSTRRIEFDIVAGTGIGLENTGKGTVIYSSYVDDNPLPSYDIGPTSTINVPDYRQMLIFGDVTLDGTLDIGTFGKVTIINGSLIAATGSTVSNPGNVELYTLMSEQRLSELHQSGYIMGNSFSVGGTYSVALGYTYSNLNYSVTVTGEVPRSWSIQNKTTSGFVVNTNSASGFTQSVYWQAMNYT